MTKNQIKEITGKIEPERLPYIKRLINEGFPITIIDPGNPGMVVTTVEENPEWPECLERIGEISGLLNVASEVRL